MSIGNKIKELRNEKGLNRAHLAEKLGITYHALSKYETNARQPDYSTLIRIADYFDVSLDYLLERTPHKKGNSFSQIKEIADDLPVEAQKVIEDFKEYIFQKYGKK
jgi:transcriptional regulator with XRE-family HTH domain